MKPPRKIAASTMCKIQPGSAEFNFIEITLRHGCLLHIQRIIFSKNTYGGLLLSLLIMQATPRKVALAIRLEVAIVFTVMTV